MVCTLGCQCRALADTESLPGSNGLVLSDVATGLPTELSPTLAKAPVAEPPTQRGANPPKCEGYYYHVTPKTASDPARKCVFLLSHSGGEETGCP